MSTKILNTWISYFFVLCISLSAHAMDADKLMIPKSQALSGSWGNSQQELWGKMTYALMETAVFKL
jgi:hypothetical protein